MECCTILVDTATLQFIKDCGAGVGMNLGLAGVEGQENPFGRPEHTDHHVYVMRQRVGFTVQTVLDLFEAEEHRSLAAAEGPLRQYFCNLKNFLVLCLQLEGLDV